MTGNVATREPEGDTVAPEGDTVAPHAALAERVREARARLDPPSVSVPAPRSAEGVVPPPALHADPDAPAKDLVAAVDALAEELDTVEGDREDDAHQVLCRIAAWATDGVPEAGWSADEGLDVEVLQATSEAAKGLQERAAALLERLDSEERHGPAAAVDSVATTLRVVGVVADLEVMERARQEGRTD
ncbi:hypothetical protein [Actinomycetospora sp. TBRC 11914]|uniref:hypothetical protein n=1 Tax=Actinomycetospora sp. TBRC 11914 TaxID=2729387 RepID=UPI00145F8CA1|nr:hypothetical protein [Actinomycetospora sp. TBRC 11914]NMO92491.1 hypothetical protein [Actinomycetospora sp. TBRC 11914]